MSPGVAGNGVHGDEVVAPVEAGNSASVRTGVCRNWEKRPACVGDPDAAPGVADGESAVGLREQPAARTRAAKPNPAAVGILSNVMRTSGHVRSKTGARRNSSGIRKLSRKAFVA